MPAKSTPKSPAAKSAAQPAAKRAAVAEKAARPAPKKKPAVATPPAAEPKAKLVRDSFTIPKPEYAVLEALKQRGASLKRPVKKSELLRAGIKALEALNDKAFLAALDKVPSLKTGRPKVVEAEAEAQTVAPKARK
ncbi:MAG: hypothetical protein Q7T55_18235 [Solirubrobacteraceae bacterium]|nr:hypothetical protein [Solirubrobacteraceae bacterium]